MLICKYVISFQFMFIKDLLTLMHLISYTLKGVRMTVRICKKISIIWPIQEIVIIKWHLLCQNIKVILILFMTLLNNLHCFRYNHNTTATKCIILCCTTRWCPVCHSTLTFKDLCVHAIIYQFNERNPVLDSEISDYINFCNWAHKLVHMMCNTYILNKKN